MLFDLNRKSGISRLFANLFHKSKAIKRRSSVWSNLKRRSTWLIGKDVLGNSINISLAMASYLLKRKSLGCPIFLKIDINSTCSLRCTVCVHANSGDNEQLKAQRFRPSQIMDIEYYRRVIEECKGKSSSVSLYYLGDPLSNRNLTTYVKIARTAGMNVDISTNFSFLINDAQMMELATCGITHFTVCVDGFTGEVYSKMRVGGNIDLVKRNLAALCTYKNNLKITDLTIEVQHLEFAHNRHESSMVIDYCEKIGVDHISIITGQLTNYTDYNFDSMKISSIKQKGLLPKCFWPYVAMIIKYDGNAFPCCTSRLGEVFADNPPDSLGNVFEFGVKSIWNSSPYKLARQSIINPKLMGNYLRKKQNFCAGCTSLCNVIPHESLGKIQQGEFEEIFENSPVGSVRRF